MTCLAIAPSSSFILYFAACVGVLLLVYSSPIEVSILFDKRGQHLPSILIFSFEYRDT